jgi:hypothetical protein
VEFPEVFYGERPDPLDGGQVNRVAWMDAFVGNPPFHGGRRRTAYFETFPFPQPDPRAVIPALEDIGERLYTARAAYMVDTQQGLTQTYNAAQGPAGE